MAEIELRHVDKHFGPFHVIRDVNLTVRDREFVVFLGPSGCGKTTTLRAIAGLEEIDTGDILIDGKPVQNLHASERDIAFVFQSYALYPHLTVYENIAFPLRATRLGSDEVDRAVQAVAEAIGITHLLRRRPSALSGGDMQRVAIGRALVTNPPLLLCDEPTGNLDPDTSWEILELLNDLNIRGTTILLATHSKDLVDQLRRRTIVLRNGQIVRDDEVGGYSL